MKSVLWSVDSVEGDVISLASRSVGVSAASFHWSTGSGGGCGHFIGGSLGRSVRAIDAAGRKVCTPSAAPLSRKPERSKD